MDLLKEIQTVREYNRQLQNELEYKEEQLTIYKEGYEENKSKLDIYFTGDVKEQFVLREGDIITPLTEQVSGLLGETATIPESNKYIQRKLRKK